MDTFPYESWADAQAGAGAEGYFTFGPGDNAATIVLVALAFLLMVVVFVWWMRVEDRKLRDQAARIGMTPMASMPPPDGATNGTTMTSGEMR